jgi:transcriptional regulator with XRE-family HTH domain
METVLTKTDALDVVADNLRCQMAKAGIGVRELARKSDNDPMTISRLMNRKNMPAADALARIAECLGVSIDSLFQSC